MSAPVRLLLALLAGAAGAAAAFPAGRALEDIGRVALLVPPLVLVLPYFPLHLGLVRRGHLGWATGTGLCWALGATLVTIPLFARHGSGFESVVWNADSYRLEMFRWITTGDGAEGDPSRFVPEHAIHFLSFAVLAFLSAGFGALMLGAALLDYMNAYVGALCAASGDTATILAFGWPLYAIVRVVGFVLVAVALSAAALRVVERSPAPPREIRRLLVAGVSLVLLDLLLKAWLAPWYRDVLHRALIA